MGRHRKRRASPRLSRRIALLSAGLLIPCTGSAAVLAATTHLDERAVPSARSRHASPPRAAITEVPGTRSPAAGRPAPAASRAAATPEATASSASSASATPPAAVPFAPYADVLTWPPLDFATISARTGVRDYTVGFVAAGPGCTATWGGMTPIDDPLVRKRIKKVPGRTIVSFGGPHTTELAADCTDVDRLTAAYRSVLDATGTEQIDFDLTDAVWQRMGVAPVVGVTGSGTGFQPADARQVRAWAAGRRLGRLSMWSVTRDTPCTTDTTSENDTCSGLDEDPGVFSRILQGP